MHTVKGLIGIALRGLLTSDALKLAVSNTDSVRGLLIPHTDSMASALSPGPYHDNLPDEVRQEVSLELFDVDQFAIWARDRVIWKLEASDPREANIRAILER